MSLLAKIVTFLAYAVATGLASGAIGNAMGNPSDAAGAWFLFLIVGVVILAVIPRKAARIQA